MGGLGARVSDCFFTLDPNLKLKTFFISFFAGGGGYGWGSGVSEFSFTMNPNLK